jgi:hypothetical protein
MPVEGVALINNIFGTLFMAAFYMWMVDHIRRGIKEKRAGLILSAIGGILLPLAAGLALLLALQSGNRAASLAFFFIPNPFSVEGGFVMILMGVLFYILRKYRLIQGALILIVSVFAWYTAENPYDFQWFVVFALIPLLLYNGNGGGGENTFSMSFTLPISTCFTPSPGL